jgi:hypothetical protein
VAKLKKFDSLLIFLWWDGPIKRLKKNEINLMRTMAWYETVRVALGVTTAHAVERLVDPTSFKMKDGLKVRPRKWGAYCTGSSIPDLRNTEHTPIALAEARAPSSSRWFFSPLWCVLNGKNLNWHDLQIYLQADPVIAPAICKYQKVGDENFPIIALNRIEKLNGLSGIELLETIVILLEIGRLTGSNVLVSKTLKLYVRRTKDIAEMPQLQNLFPTLLDYVEGRYLPSAHVPYDKNFIPPWHIREPALYDPIFETFVRKVRLEHPELIT